MWESFRPVTGLGIRTPFAGADPTGGKDFRFSPLELACRNHCEGAEKLILDAHHKKGLKVPPRPG